MSDAPAETDAAALPVDAVLPDVTATLAARKAAVLVAPPGAGKTTRVPLALARATWATDGRILVLEPRRLAARAAARRMAEELGESVGGTVGYHIRQERRAGKHTRVEVVTEGILTRRLQSDPALEGVAAVLFDEFHERSLHADLGLALTLDVQGALRDDLRLLVMSATLDTAPIARVLGDVPVLESHGRSYPVTTHHQPRPKGALPAAVAGAVAEALENEAGSVLAFLPGEREIRECARALGSRVGKDTEIHPLYGALPAKDQEAAIVPAPQGKRKVVIATSIAETSLTIEDVRVVVDGGYTRRARFDPQSGMTRLVTEKVSRAEADQRRGRAGRTAPGVCYRLWPQAEHGALPQQPPPEIVAADLAPLALELARWGVHDPNDLAWIDPPPDGALAQARDLLADLGALDRAGRITRHGHAMAALPMHPRLAHMGLMARERDLGALACAVAALLEERDILGSGPGGRHTDLRHRLRVLAGGQGPEDTPVHESAKNRVNKNARDRAKRLGVPEGPIDPEAAGQVLALAYPDRVALPRWKKPGHYQLASGKGATLATADPLTGYPALAAATLDPSAGADARILLAAPVRRDDLEATLPEMVREADEVVWDPRYEKVTSYRVKRLGAVALDWSKLHDPPAGDVAAALMDGIRHRGPSALPWTKAARQLQDRVAFVRGLPDEDPDAWPDLSDQALMDGLETWLAPFAGHARTPEALEGTDMAALLAGLLTPEQQQKLDRLVPSHVTLGNGMRVRVNYSGDEPALRAPVQTFFGTAETPTILGGTRTLALHLLDPGGKPMQVTRDLAKFWQDAYARMRRQMRAEYPRHDWPEDPVNAEPRGKKGK